MPLPEFKTEQNPETLSTAIVEIFDAELIAMPPGTKAKPRPPGKERKPIPPPNGESQPPPSGGIN